MSKFLIFKPFIRKIENGTFLVKYFSAMLGYFSFCIFLLGLYYTKIIWDRYNEVVEKLETGADYTNTMIYFIIIQVVIVILIYFVINVVLVRASDIKKLSIATGYTVIPMIAIFVKMIGEIFFIRYLLFGLLLSTSALMDSHYGIVNEIFVTMPFKYLFILSGYSINGFGPFLFGSFISFISLILFYFIAEQIGVLAEIATNTKNNQSHNLN